VPLQGQLDAGSLNGLMEGIFRLGQNCTINSVGLVHGL
jgi:hypothetical protein